MRSPLLSFAILALLTLSSAPARAMWVQDGVALSTAAGDQFYPTIASDGAGGAIVTWFDSRGGTYYDIYAQRVDASGAPQWTADGLAVCTAALAQSNPTVASDGAGGAIITWDDWRSGDRVIYAQRVNASGVAQWTADGVAVGPEVGEHRYPKIVSDGAGGAIITWHDALIDGILISDVYAQRVDASGVVQWNAEGVLLCTAAGDQQYPMIVSDGAGGAIITWHDGRTGYGWDDPDIYAQRVDASGTPQWTADGVALCATAERQVDPTIVSDGAGGAIVTWYDYRYGLTNHPDIFAQRVNDSGVVQWTVDGVALCTAAHNQWYPTIVSDAAGGAIVTWYDYRTGGSPKIYAQRVNASGAPQWTADGIALSLFGTNPTIVPDGAGGAIITWQAGDIYTQRLDASGVPQWTANGVALCTAAGDQRTPKIVSDGAGGGIVTWMDLRSGNADVYTQRVFGSGSVPTGVRDTPSTTALTVLQNHPNPFSATTTLEIGLAVASPVQIDIFDVAGRRVREISVAGAEAGWRSVPFDGRDDRGRALSSGVYFFRVRASGTSVTRKMIIAR